jgi:hypothetical protein
VKYYLDENLSQVSAKIARDAGIDVTSSHEVGMDGRLDLEQVRFAAADGRVLVTHDLGDMGKALAELADRGEQHAGVLFIPRSIRVDDFAGVARAVQRWEEEHPEGMPVGFVGYVRNPRLTR